MSLESTRSQATANDAWRDAPAPDLAFPYMAWAHTHSFRTAHPLSQSGMPQANPDFLRELGHEHDLDHPSREALPALEDAIAQRFGVPRSRVIVTLGASGGMFLCGARWFRAGSRVVTDVPSYEPFRALPRFFGAQLRELDRRAEERFGVDPDRVRSLLAQGSGPGHVFLANPHNPTGVMLDSGELEALAREAGRAGGVLVSCDIYMEYVPRAEAAWAFAAAPNAVTIGSLTKAYGLGSLRIGWIVLGEGLEHERARLVDGAYLTYVDPPTASLRAGRLALQNLDALRAPLGVIERESRPIFERFLRETPGIECTVPKHGIIAFPRIAGVADTFALCEFLVREHQVDVVPGEFFGRAGHVRVGCGVAPATLKAGLERLARGIAAFRAQQ